MTRADSRREWVRTVLSRLDEAGATQPEDRRLLCALEDQLAQDRFRVLVTGEAKRGKSTLLNALLGRDVLPTGAVPVTALATTIQEGDPEGVTVRFAGGRVEEHPSDALSGYVTQAANPGNALGVAEVVLRLHAPLLAHGVQLVDTPGTGSVHGQNTGEALASLRTMDAALFVLTADPPISAAEHDLLHLVAQTSVRTFVVLNKADLIDAADLPEVVAFVGDVAGKALGEPVAVHVCAARAGARRGGNEFSAVLARYLADHRDEDLVTSLARRARQLATALLDEVLLHCAVADLDASRKSAQLRDLRGALDTLGERRAEATALVHAQCDGILQEVNAQAQPAGAALARQVTEAWSAQWEAHSGEWNGREREAQGRSLLVDLTRAAVPPWRTEQEELVTQRLAALDARLRDRR
ncbi:dynamin family protein [Streptomyces sp900116325]|uniref:dynamin family protein n=1 Tax=Streptomyces sp. 900116325 TaxID=3154295 RepID=UPI0033A0C851